MPQTRQELGEWQVLVKQRHASMPRLTGHYYLTPTRHQLLAWVPPSPARMASGNQPLLPHRWWHQAKTKPVGHTQRGIGTPVTRDAISNLNLSNKNQITNINNCYKKNQNRKSPLNLLSLGNLIGLTK